MPSSSRPRPADDQGARLLDGDANPESRPSASWPRRARTASPGRPPTKARSLGDMVPSEAIERARRPIRPNPGPYPARAGPAWASASQVPDGHGLGPMDRREPQERPAWPSRRAFPG
ncbi:MAG: hypothetical protein LBP92_07245 [Deltaproteobacteria bacterium]|nr:hypothetical protein [Deltaproteobacteria bacterium]